MADPTSMTTAAAAGKLLASEHSDVLREAVRLMLIELMEGEVSELAGSGLYERSAERATQRNGYRARQWDTRVGSLELAIPRLRSGSYLAATAARRYCCEAGKLGLFRLGRRGKMARRVIALWPRWVNCREVGVSNYWRND